MLTIREMNGSVENIIELLLTAKRKCTYRLPGRGVWVHRFPPLSRAAKESMRAFDSLSKDMRLPAFKW